MSDTRLLIVHPEPSASALMRSMLQSLGHRIDEAASDRVAVRMLEHGAVDLVLVGVDPYDPDALELLMYLRRKQARVPVLLLFTVPHQDRTREALQRGAAAVLRFPMPANHLRAAVAQTLGQPEVPQAPPTTTWSQAHGPESVGHRNHHPDPHQDHHPTPAPPDVPAPGAGRGLGADRSPAGGVFIGDDPSLLQAIELAETIAPTRAPILVHGERGTGKTLVARTLHHQSPRKGGPFIKVACGTLKETALEVELFGRKGGGHADGGPDRLGKVALAQGGTLYIDEVTALSPHLQFKLLRLLQEQAFEPVGSIQTLRADVRVVLGTKEDLTDLVERGLFRQDLSYRIGVVSLKLPPLRHRPGDIEPLANHFLARFAREAGKEVVGFVPEALDLLREHDWPGNVHELETAVERGVLLGRGPRIEPAHLGLPAGNARTSSGPAHTPRPHLTPGIRPLKEALEEPEKQIILQALEALNWNRQETARVLDINRTTLYKKMKKYGLLVDEPVWVN